MYRWKLFNSFFTKKLLIKQIHNDLPQKSLHWHDKIVCMILSGRKALLIISSLLVSVLFPSTAFGVTNNIYVESSAEGGSDATASIKSNVALNNNSTTTKTAGKTDIVIECNGVKKEYHSDKVEDVELNCDNSTTGTVKSQVNITTNTSPAAKISPRQISEEEKENINDEKKEIKEKVLGAKTKLGEERRDLFEQMTQFFRELFKNFHF